MPDVVLRAEHVTKRFGGITALEDAQLELYKGEVHALVGANGAGKSTLVRCINHIEVPTEGKVIVQDKDLSKLTHKELRKQREHIGMIFQHFNLLMQKSVLDNVCFP